jgi:hypothetical protein
LSEKTFCNGSVAEIISSLRINNPAALKSCRIDTKNYNGKVTLTAKT